MSFRPQGCRRAERWSERSAEAGEPTGARGNRRLSVVRAVHEPTRSESEGEHVCGPGVILTANVKGAREISAGRSPLAKQVARAVRARQNHAGGVPANCGSVSPERSEPRSGRYAGCEQVGRRPHHRAARRNEIWQSGPRLEKLPVVTSRRRAPRRTQST